MAQGVTGGRKNEMRWRGGLTSAVAADESRGRADGRVEQGSSAMPGSGRKGLGGTGTLALWHYGTLALWEGLHGARRQSRGAWPWPGCGRPGRSVRVGGRSWAIPVRAALQWPGLYT